MSKFRKRPVVIEVVTFDEFIAYGINQGVPITNGMPWSFEYAGHPVTHENDDCYLIPTLEGVMRFDRGSMLITGVNGEIYPCKPDIFEKTYEAAILVERDEELRRVELPAGSRPVQDVIEKLETENATLRQKLKTMTECRDCREIDKEILREHIEILSSVEPK